MTLLCISGSLFLLFLKNPIPSIKYAWKGDPLGSWAVNLDQAHQIPTSVKEQEKDPFAVFKIMREPKMMMTLPLMAFCGLATST